MSEAPQRFVILGGGTAGWMAACLIAHRLGQRAAVTLVESPDIGIIGVGEGSTPQLKAFFDELGIAEAEWMPRCNATYKNGIRFEGWSDAPGFERYFHPFPTAIDDHTAGAFLFHTRARRTGRDAFAHPDRFLLLSRLANERRGPIAGENFPFDIGYGYHFDAHLVGEFLRDHAVSKLGVIHLPRRVADCRVDETGQIAALVADGGEEIAGDFFVDASGFRAELIQQALGEPFESFAGNLFNDAAVAMPSPPGAGPTPCETGASALSNGWAWKIPLTGRTGNGYVYSSRYSDADAAETELRRHLGLLDADVAARHLAMKVGQVRRSWVGNCLAVGLAQGFIEPLEATALHVVHSTVSGFVDAYEAGGFTGTHADAFNSAIYARYEGIRDYIVCHYRMNRRQGEYWRANAQNQDLSDNLKTVITAWFRGDDLAEVVQDLDIARYYAPLSWHCLLGGYGQYPDPARLVAAETDLPLADLGAVDRFITGCALNFAPHDDLLARLV
ncbi:tryptophan halogenase family protein [Novosphingobium sp.]|uniref:tryptophan halogenase family protein n=1 Tax=Novosphingobium sp. TaxID=1874826 RepID=UPI0025DB45A1|nr:tryptophan halogenase family protein [Novosphingobium sp.]